MSPTQRIPKWLASERFALYHESNLGKLVFRLQIFNETGDPFDGSGNSIAEAAKNARKAREGEK